MYYSIRTQFCGFLITNAAVNENASKYTKYSSSLVKNSEIAIHVT